jgi:hypothetical protein
MLPARSTYGFPLGTFSLRDSATVRLPVPGLQREAANHQHASGATVRLDDVALRTTPFEKDLEGRLLPRDKTRWAHASSIPIVARISLTGYATREQKLTESPMNWISI